MDSPEEHLLHNGVKPTSVRILVWKEICRKTKAFTLGDIENALPDMDRSSIFRSLRLFTEHHLLHEIDDGTGQQKYCLCRCEDNNHVNHVHFTCTECGQTYCLTDYAIPVVDVPEGFVSKEIEYVIKGLCHKCSGK